MSSGIDELLEDVHDVASSIVSSGIVSAAAGCVDCGGCGGRGVLSASIRTGCGVGIVDEDVSAVVVRCASPAEIRCSQRFFCPIAVLSSSLSNSGHVGTHTGRKLSRGELASAWNARNVPG
eukprot:6475769-Amphidinium_carterae.2